MSIRYQISHKYSWMMHSIRLTVKVKEPWFSLAPFYWFIAIRTILAPFNSSRCDWLALIKVAQPNKGKI